MASPCDKTPVVEKPNEKVSNNPFLSIDKSSDKSDNTNASWKMVDHRHLKSEKQLWEPKQGPAMRNDLVREAKKLLINEETQWIHNRRCAKEGESRGPCPLTQDNEPSKGKNPDPRNWGDIDIEESERDPEAQ